jgi:CrcB protein
VTLPLLLAIGAIGGLAAVARFLLDAAVSARAGREFPWGTLAVNLSGSALLGLVAGIALHGEARLLVATGLIGSYTTFSTWMLESVRLAEWGRLRLALLNVVGGLVLGLGAVALGRLVGELL